MLISAGRHRCASSRAPATGAARAARAAGLTATLAVVWAGLLGAPASMAATAGTAASSKSAFPLTINNCGNRITFQRPPRRAASLSQATSEVMLHLGLGRSMIGTAFQSSPVFAGGAGFASIRASYARVPVLATQYPSAEVLLNARPDLVIGNSDVFIFGPRTSGGTGFTRAEMARRGIKTYTLVCAGERQTNALLLRRYQELGRIFGIPTRTTSLIRRVRRALASTASTLRGVRSIRTFYYEFGRGPLSTYGGGGAFDFGLSLAGGTNIFRERPTFPNPQVSAEEVIARNPAAIVIVARERSHGTPAQKRQFLVSTLGRSVTAVRNNRFCYMDFAGFSTGPRQAVTLRRVAPCLHPNLKFP